jgi:hypothetical protein
VNVEFYTPVGVVHPDGLLTLKDLDFVDHHTGLVECRLSVENNDVSVPDMSVDLLVPSWRTYAGARIVPLGSE